MGFGGSNCDPILQAELAYIDVESEQMTATVMVALRDDTAARVRGVLFASSFPSLAYSGFVQQSHQKKPYLPFPAKSTKSTNRVPMQTNR